MLAGWRGMSRKRTKQSVSAQAATKILVMRIYISNNAPNSLQAIANLAAICRECLENKFKLEVIDVLKYPLRALADGILVTPSLVKVSPSPAAKVMCCTRSE
jgi:circadian clock protein KaiB